MEHIDWTPVLTALVALLGVLLTVARLELANWVRSRYSQQEIERGLTLAGQAVAAVEQMTTTMGWDSQRKKDKALEMVNDLGARFGLNLDDEQWEALIEAAVKQMRDIRTELKKPIEAGASPGGG